MHEATLVDALFDQLDALAAPGGGPLDPRTVREVELAVGEASGVEPDLLAAAFEALRDPRGYGAAALVITREPVRWRCPACGDAPGPGPCPGCGGPPALAAGGALRLDRVELEVPDV